MSLALSGKLALVTGAGRGIGRAIALRLADDGARVIVHCSVSFEAAEELANKINAARPGTARTVRADLSTLAGVDALAAVLAPGEQVDILVNNAGLQVDDDGIETIGEADFDLLYAVNVKAPFFLTQRLLDRIADNGRVINISSGLSMVAHPDKIAYGMTKAALNAFTRSLAKVVGARGITANAVTPGVVATDMNPWANTPQGAAMLSGSSALKRVGRPEDIANLVAILAGPDSQWSTGAVIDASGGANI